MMGSEIELNLDQALLRRQMIDILTLADLCVVDFNKTNGENRVMKCTLNPTHLPVAENIDHKPRNYSNSAIRVFDINKGEWRAFRIDLVNKIIAVDVKSKTETEVYSKEKKDV